MKDKLTPTQKFVIQRLFETHSISHGQAILFLNIDGVLNSQNYYDVRLLQRFPTQDNQIKMNHEMNRYFIYTC